MKFKANEYLSKNDQIHIGLGGNIIDEKFV